MKFKNLIIQNFLSIQDIEINLDNTGLVLVQGENLDDPNFKSNGAGKTTLIDSIAWVLYGRTLKGLKSDEVLHTTLKKGCMVSLEIEDDNGDEYKVIRGRKHKEYKNSVLVYKGETNITEKADKDTNAFIETLIQMTYEVFTATILYSSNSFKFTSSTDAEMKKSLDSMLNMEFWNLCLDATKKRVESIKSKIKEVESERNKYIDTQNILLEQQQNLIQKSEDSEVAYSRKKVELKQRLEKVKTEISELKDTSWDTDKIEKTINDLQNLIAVAATKISKFDEIFDKINDKKSLISEINGLLKISNRNIDDLTSKATKHLKKLEDKKSLIDTSCPVCGSKITEDTLLNATVEIKKELKTIMTDLQKEKATKSKYESLSNTLQSKLEDLQNEYKQRQPFLDKKEEYAQLLANNKAKISQNAELKKSYERSKKQYENNIAMLEKDIENCNAPLEDTYTSSINDLTIQIEGYTKKLKNLTSTLEIRLEELKNTEVWLDPYSNKGIKSLLLDNVTPFLNKQSNYYLGKLTSGSIEINFKTQSETKSGNLQDKFIMEIQNKNGGDKYIANSDGERRRIDISVNLALQDLIASRSSKKINVAFFDECFDSLDNIGSERVVEILNENGNNKSSIFVTTHNESLKAFFDKSIVLVKQNGFTSLKENM